MPHPVVTLRPRGEDEESPDSSSEYDDWGTRDGPMPPELGRMLVLADGVVVGDVSWHSVWYGPNSGSKARNIGISLTVGARGRGIGWRAQRLLVEHLFATTDAGRIEAGTDVQNIAEQRALEKAGFQREGVLRGAQVRSDGRHDMVSFAILRTDLEPPA